jgi:hypothetical protein
MGFKWTLWDFRLLYGTSRAPKQWDPKGLRGTSRDSTGLESAVSTLENPFQPTDNGSFFGIEMQHVEMSKCVLAQKRIQT